MSRERRRLLHDAAEESSAEPGRYGCPMLSRLHATLMADANRPVYRCSLGWALTSELDVTCCAATEAVIDCWKVHPERTPVTVLPVAEAEEMKLGAD
ncbi:MAG: hypothetical protein ACRDJW_24685 [Thermomicrobiales bacterium]